MNDAADFHALRKISVRKNILPQIKINATFNKPVYEENSAVGLQLALRAKNGDVLPNGAFEVSWWRQGKRLETISKKADQQGKVSLLFQPQDTIAGSLIKVRATQGGQQTTLNLPLPYQKAATIQFHTFPEGGYLVTGIKSKLAFMAVEAGGGPVAVAGTLQEDGKPLLSFKSGHAGMGSLNFVPKENKSYTIKLTEPRNATYEIRDIRTKGITLRLTENSKESLVFTITKSPSIKQQQIYLRAQTRGRIYSMAKGILKDSLQIRLPRQEFPQGIAEVTLFDETLRPLAERLVYVNLDKKLYIEAKLDKDTYGTRAKATLKVKVTDEKGQPVPAHLGLSVYDKLYRNKEDDKNILIHYYLSSQLKGRLYDLAYYFEPQNEGREKSLNLLLLTQGWRRYVWQASSLPAVAAKQVIYNNTPGAIEGLRAKELQAGNLFAMLFSPENEKYKSLIPLDPAGRFTVKSQDLASTGGGYVYIRSMVPENTRLRIDIQDPFTAIEAIRKRKRMSYPVKYTEEKEEVPAFNMSRGVRLGEVLIKGRGEAAFRDKYMGSLDSLAKLNLTTDYVCLTSIILNCPCHPGSRRKPVEGKEYTVLRDNGYKFLPNGRIAFWDFYRINYKYPKLTEEELLRRNNMGRVKGYYAYKEFYQPNYEDQNEQSASLPDFRNTLIWEPSLITDKNGEATISFFCSDLPLLFTGHIEGVSGEGLLGSTRFELSVKEAKK